jgi:YD repeat-containing protein
MKYDSKNRTTRYVYDDKARIKETIYFDNSRRSLTYDSQGRVKPETNELNQTTLTNTMLAAKLKLLLTL